jgi:molybdopterin molybdotransferase
MMGRHDLCRPILEVRVADRLVKKPGRLHFVRVTLERRDGEWQARSTGNQSSGVMTSMARADGLLIFPEEASELVPGATRASLPGTRRDFSSGFSLG